MNLKINKTALRQYCTTCFYRAKVKIKNFFSFLYSKLRDGLRNLKGSIIYAKEEVYSLFVVKTVYETSFSTIEYNEAVNLFTTYNKALAYLFEYTKKKIKRQKEFQEQNDELDVPTHLDLYTLKIQKHGVNTEEAPEIIFTMNVKKFAEEQVF